MRAFATLGKHKVVLGMIHLQRPHVLLAIFLKQSPSLLVTVLRMLLFLKQTRQVIQVIE